MILFSGLSSPVLAFGAPIVLDPPVVMDVLSTNDEKSEIRYRGQPAKQGKIDLTAANGFFDTCFQAMDERQITPGDEGLITSSFGYLGRWSDKDPGTARWHLWCAEKGEIKATFFMQVPAAETNHIWVIKVGDETQTLKVSASDGRAPQIQTLKFTVKQPGKVTLAIDCTKTPPPAQTRICFIRLEGSAIGKASLLRTRWRPSAVHVGFYPPKICPTPNMWVFETKSVKSGGYAPLTTPFGYFGTGFNKAGCISIGDGFNFSMWIAGRGATNAPPIKEWARLIGTDIPEAQYGSFGHEGTGVKFRNAPAYKEKTDRTIQALRGDLKDGLWTFYGYFYDEQEQRWRLYGSAQLLMRGGEKARRTYVKDGTMCRTGSFLEIPGRASRTRCGDVVSEIKRRGWFYGSDHKWYRAQMNDQRYDTQPRREAKSPKLDGTRAYYMDDYATDGWMSMAMGGIECYISPIDNRMEPPKQAGEPAPLPDYLRPEKAAQLFDLPVRFGASKASVVSSDHATIDYEIEKTGPNSKAVLYYGTVDSLTYPPQKVTRGSAVLIDMYRPEHTWQSATQGQTVTTGTNQFKLIGLKGGTTYYYRLFVAHDEGKSWDYQSGRFETPGPGDSISQNPRQTAIGI